MGTGTGTVTGSGKEKVRKSNGTPLLRLCSMIPRTVNNLLFGRTGVWRWPHGACTTTGGAASWRPNGWTGRISAWSCCRVGYAPHPASPCRYEITSQRKRKSGRGGGQIVKSANVGKRGRMQSLSRLAMQVRNPCQRKEEWQWGGGGGGS